MTDVNCVNCKRPILTFAVGTVDFVVGYKIKCPHCNTDNAGKYGAVHDPIPAFEDARDDNNYRTVADDMETLRPDEE